MYHCLRRHHRCVLNVYDTIISSWLKSPDGAQMHRFRLIFSVFVLRAAHCGIRRSLIQHSVFHIVSVNLIRRSVIMHSVLHILDVRLPFIEYFTPNHGIPNFIYSLLYSN